MVHPRLCLMMRMRRGRMRRLQIGPICCATDRDRRYQSVGGDGTQVLSPCCLHGGLIRCRCVFCRRYNNQHVNNENNNA